MKVNRIGIWLVVAIFSCTSLNAQNFNEEAYQIGQALGRRLAGKMLGAQVLEGNVEGVFYRTDDNHVGFYAENISKYDFDIAIQFYRPSIGKQEKQALRLTAKGNLEYHPQDFNSNWVFLKGDIVTFSLSNGMKVSWTCPVSDRHYEEQTKNTKKTIVVDNSQDPQVRLVTQPCSACHGSKRCSVCSGMGMTTYWVSSGQRAQQCGGCRGTGTCQTCYGTGTMQVSEYR